MKNINNDSQNMKDRRKYPRIDIKERITVRELNSNGKNQNVTTRNISVEGLSFNTNKLFPKNTILEVQLKIKKNIHIVGKVVWSKKVETPHPKNKAYTTGIKIQEIIPCDEVEFFQVYITALLHKIEEQLES